MRCDEAVKDATGKVVELRAASTTNTGAKIRKDAK